MKVFKTNTLIRKTIIYDVYFYKEPPFRINEFPVYGPT